MITNSFVLNRTPKHRQRGLAMVISLVLLIAMTVIAVATMSGNRLNERVTSNTQQKAISFEAAESAIRSVMNEDKAIEAMGLMADEFNDPGPVSFTDLDDQDLDDQLSEIFDQKVSDTDETLTVDIETKLTAQYCGESVRSATSLSADLSEARYTGVVLQYNGISTIAGSNAESDHLQRISIARASTGRTGNCVAPN